MATRGTWDLSAGSDFDFSGNKQIEEANKLFQQQQRIYGDALKLDEVEATQELRIGALNAKNQEYVDDIEAANELRRLLSDDQDVTETVAEQIADIPVAPKQQRMIQQHQGDDGTEYFTDENGNVVDGAITEGQAPGQSTTQKLQIKPEQTVTRKQNLVERIDRALTQTSNARVRLKLQDLRQAEISKTAATLAASDPIAAFKILKESGNQFVPDLRRTSSGYKQTLPDGREIDVDDLQASFMVGDVIKGTNDRLKYIKEVQFQRAKEQADDRKSQREQREKADELRLKFTFDSLLEGQKQRGREIITNARGGRYSRPIIGYDTEGSPIFGAAQGGGAGGGGAGTGGASGNPGKIDSGDVVAGRAATQASSSMDYLGAQKAAMQNTNFEELEAAMRGLNARRDIVYGQNKTSPELALIDSTTAAIKKRMLELYPQYQKTMQQSSRNFGTGVITPSSELAK